MISKQKLKRKIKTKRKNKGGSTSRGSKKGRCKFINVSAKHIDLKEASYITDTLLFLPIPKGSTGGASLEATGFSKEGFAVRVNQTLFPLAVYDEHSFEHLKSLDIKAYRDQVDANALGAGAKQTARPLYNTCCTLLVALFLFGPGDRTPVQDDIYKKLIRLRLSLGEFNTPNTKPHSWQLFSCAVNETMTNTSEELIKAKLAQFPPIPDKTMGAVLARITWKDQLAPHISIIVYMIIRGRIEFRIIELQSNEGIVFIPGTTEYNAYACRIKHLSIVSGSNQPSKYSNLLLGAANSKGSKGSKGAAKP